MFSVLRARTSLVHVSDEHVPALEQKIMVRVFRIVFVIPERFDVDSALFTVRNKVQRKYIYMPQERWVAAWRIGKHKLISMSEY
jgi:hypothetical protein